METALALLCATFLFYFTPAYASFKIKDACSLCKCSSDISGFRIVNCSSSGVPRTIPKGTSHLDLSYNGISTLSVEDVERFKGIKVLDLSGNPLICDCPLALSIKQLTSSDDAIVKGQCSTPEQLSSFEVNELDPMNMQCYSSVSRHRTKRSNEITQCTPGSHNCHYLICNKITFWLPMTTDWGCCYGEIHDLTSSYCFENDGVTKCSGSDFRCNNQHCLPSHWVCNRYNDCQDGSDELNCGGCTNPLMSFQCKNSRCVNKNRVCDTYNDCGDGSDEVFCRKSFSIGWCGINGFRCANEKCIYMETVCDDYDDCEDNSDELGCLKNSSARCSIGWSPLQDSCYKLFSSKSTWTSAQATCVKNDGYLTKIVSKTEEQFLQNLTLSQADTLSWWFGLSKKDGAYRWTDGTALGNYKPWDASEPSSIGGCVLLVNSTMKWRVEDCDIKNPFICSRDVTCTRPCQNGGTCGSAGCICASPWTGDDCSYVLPVIQSLSAIQDTKVKYNTTLSFSCQARGVPRPHIEWLLNEQPVTSQHDISIFKEAFVTNVTINVKETVELRCNASNRGGMDTVRLRIVVEDDDVTSVKTTIRLTKIQYNDSLKDPLSSESKSLVKKVTYALFSLYTNSPGFKGLSILQFRPGSVISDLLFQFSTESKDELTNVLRDTIKSGFIANFTVDSKYFHAEKITTVCPHDFFNVTWPAILPTSTRAQQCPYRANGIARRRCDVRGTWEYPDYRECISKAIMELQNRMSTVLTKATPSPIEVQDILSNLVDKSSPPKGASKMAGDIKVTTLILTEIVRYNSELSNDVENSTKNIQNFLLVASNLLDDQNNKEMKLLQQSDHTTTLLMSALDGFSLQAAGSLETTQIHTKQFVASNIVMGISVFLNTSSTDIKFPDYNNSRLMSMSEWHSVERSYIVLPKSAFDDSKKSATQVKRVSSFLYRTLSSFLDIESAYDNVGNGFLLSSNIISASVKPVVSFIKNPVVTIYNKDKNDNKTSACVFWDFELNSLGGGWSRDGCRLSFRDGSRITCECDHLTNFAVLMSTYDLKEHELPLRIITFIGCGLSLLGLVITLLVHFIFWRNLKSEKTIIHVNLCVALIAANVILLGGLDRTSNKIICKTVAALLHYLFLSAVAWMLVEGIQIYVAIVLVFQIERKRKYFYLIGWGSPLVIVGVAMAVTQMQGYGGENACWLSSDKGLIYAFIGPVLAVVLINIIIFLMVIRAMMTTQKMISANEKQKARLAAKCCAVLLPLLGLTWVFGVLAVDHNVVVFLYLFAILNSLQGFFIFVFHCLLDQQVRTAINTWRIRREGTDSALGLRGLSSSNQSNNTKDTVKIYTASTTPDNASNRKIQPKHLSEKYKLSSA